MWPVQCIGFKRMVGKSVLQSPHIEPGSPGKMVAAKALTVNFGTSCRTARYLWRYRKQKRTWPDPGI